MRVSGGIENAIKATSPMLRPQPIGFHLLRKRDFLLPSGYFTQELGSYGLQFAVFERDEYR